MKYVAFARLYFNLVYGWAKVEVVQSWQDESNGSVHIQWRLSGLTQMQTMMFWMFRLFKLEEGLLKLSR